MSSQNGYLDQMKDITVKICDVFGFNSFHGSL